MSETQSQSVEIWNEYLQSQLAAPERRGGSNVSRWVHRLDDSSSAAARLRKSADSIVNATLRRLWVKGGGGVWGCLNGANNTLTPVRTIVDYQAIAHLISSDLNSSVRKQMADFFVRELAYPCAGCHWPIALSREDALEFIDRPDHGTTGSYASWPPMAAQALAELDGSFRRATPFFLSTAPTARLGP